jgi:hypothetical protein
MTPTHYSERTLEVEGWQVRIISYELEGAWHAKADNVSPGANLARATGASREEAEQSVLDRARKMLSRTRRQSTA